MDYEAIVVGGGVMGLSTLRHLQRRGLRRVALFERDRLGGPLGSSHGTSRIIRAAYEDPLWVRLVMRALAEDWPLLESELGERLIFPRDGLFMGPEDGMFPRYARSVHEAGAAVEGLSRAAMAARFPQFRLLPGEAAMWDRTAGVVAAERTLLGLRARCLADGAELREGVEVLELDPASPAVRTLGGWLQAERLVICAGPWSGGLVPHLAPVLRPTRQSVGYFQVAGAADFPVWVWLGRGLHEHVYGLPAFGHAGIKAALYDTETLITNLDDAGSPQVQPVREFLSQHLSTPLGPTLHAETCRFTNTPQADFVLSPWPGCPRTVVGAGFSGHGFKLAPLVGRVLAGLALDGPSQDGQSGVPEIDEDRARFSGAAGAPGGYSQA